MRDQDIKTLKRENRQLREQLQQACLDLTLSYECLALEQTGAKAAEASLQQAESQLRLALASLEQAQARVSQYEDLLGLSQMRASEADFEAQTARLELENQLQRGNYLEEHLYLSEERRLADRTDLLRLAGRLEAAQERARELEAMLSERRPGASQCLDQTLAQLLGHKQFAPASSQATAPQSRTQVEQWMGSWSLS